MGDLIRTDPDFIAMERSLFLRMDLERQNQRIERFVLPALRSLGPEAADLVALCQGNLKLLRQTLHHGTDRNVAVALDRARNTYPSIQPPPPRPRIAPSPPIIRLPDYRPVRASGAFARLVDRLRRRLRLSLPRGSL